MRKINKHKLIQTIFTSFGIFFVGILLCIAIIFPTYYCKVYDKNTLNKISYTNAIINTYETSYESFPEKIRALALTMTNFGEYRLRAIRINEPELNMNRRELTKIANNELADMNKYFIIQKKFKLNPKRLTVRERYTIYQADGGDDLQSISCLKLVYENPKKTITLYIDEEFHKIYSLDIMHNSSANNNLTDKNSTDDTSTDDTSTDTSVSYEKSVDMKTTDKGFVDYDTKAETSTDYTPSIYNSGQLYTIPDKEKVFSGVLEYYNLNSGNNYSNTAFDSWLETDQFHILFIFENTYAINFYEQFFNDEYGKLHYVIGIPIKEMIQI